ncbi:MAG: N-acetylmuramoyl-L-alanine amidase [Alphaproteobacteria bacterium]
MKIIKHPLSHFSERNSQIDMIVLHCSALNSKEMIDVLDERKLSSHYIIGYEGELIQTIEEDKKAWHAGISFWNEKTNINDRSIGIELSNETLGQTAYSEKQIEVLSELLKELIKKYHIKPQNIVAHSDIAPLRKPDPGITFPWQKLANERLGLWYNLKDSENIFDEDVSELLEIIGYDTRDEESTIASAYAFRRRFMPKEIAIEQNVTHLIDNVYPTGKKELLKGNDFIKTLKAVAYQYTFTK